MSSRKEIVASSLNDSQVRTVIVICSIGLSCVILAIFFLLRFILSRWRQAYRSTSAEPASVGISRSDETHPLLASSSPPSVSSYNTAANAHCSGREDEVFAIGVGERKGDEAAAIVVPVWDASRPFFQVAGQRRSGGDDGKGGKECVISPIAETGAATPSARSRSRVSGGDGESPVPLHRAAHENGFTARALDADVRDIRETGPSVCDEVHLAQQTSKTAGRGAPRNGSASVLFGSERDERELLSREEQFERTRLCLNSERALLDVVLALRAEREGEVKSLTHYRDAMECAVMPALFNDLQSAAEELAQSEEAMLTAVGRQQSVLRMVEAQSAAQEGALLTRINALVSQLSTVPRRGSTGLSNVSSSVSTPRPETVEVPNPASPPS